MTTDRFIAAFYMIYAQRMQALNQLYKEIYPNNNKREKRVITFLIESIGKL